MTRTQQLMTLIEARNPITFAEMQEGTQWGKKLLCRALMRLMSFGVVRVVGNCGMRRTYGPEQ